MKTKKSKTLKAKIPYARFTNNARGERERFHAVRLVDRLKQSLKIAQAMLLIDGNARETLATHSMRNLLDAINDVRALGRGSK